MRETHGHVKATEGSGAFGTPRMPTRPMTWSMTAKAKPHKPSEFESALLAIAGHDLRQPLQVIQNVHDILDRGLRTASELRLLRYGQSAVERLRDQLDKLLAALRLCESGKRVKLASVRVEPLLQQATYANKVAALTKESAFVRLALRLRAMLCFSVPFCATWSAMPSNTHSLVAAFSSVAGTPTRGSALTCMTLESA
jgi:His Kinase A (phospho-acceptor) domain